MTTLVLFIIINIIISIYIEKQKMKIATISHAVMFIVISVFLLLTSTGSLFSDYFITLMGSEAYEILLDSLTIGVTVGMIIVTPIMILKLIVFLKTFVVGVYITIECIRSIKALCEDFQIRVNEYRINSYPSEDKTFLKETIKLFRINCVIRC